MKITRTVTREMEITEVVDVRCNKCGESCVPPNWRDNLFDGKANAYGLAEAIVSGGYDSYALEDGTNYTFSICEPCLKALFATFTIPVDEESFIG